MSNWQRLQRALPLIDTHQLQQLEQQLGQSVVTGLLHLFVEEGELHASTLLQAVAGGEYQAAAKICHSIKSACGSYGALRCQYLTEKLEVACRQQQVAHIQVLAPAWQQAWGDTLTLLATTVNKDHE